MFRAQGTPAFLPLGWDEWRLWRRVFPRLVDLQEPAANLLSMSAQTPLEIGKGVASLGIAEPALGTRPEARMADAATDWLCVWCHNRVANETDRFKYDGKDEFTFSNPEGIRFDIITFSQTLGCSQTGKPTLDHTWFPGHAWSFCVCDRCGQHLGWYYAGSDSFAGLIKSRIVRALTIRN
jgi:hypothetical protein